MTTEIPLISEDPGAKSFYRACGYADAAHRGQVDKAGEPYFFHVFRVGASLVPDWSAARVGVLHDVLEDCPQIRPVELRSLLAGNGEMQALLLLSRGKFQTYDEYIRRLADVPLARKVKLADLADTMRPERMAAAERAGHNMSRLVYRYGKAQHWLRKAEAGLPFGPRPGCGDCDDWYGCTMNCGEAPARCGRMGKREGEAHRRRAQPTARVKGSSSGR